MRQPKGPIVRQPSHGQSPRAARLLGIADTLRTDIGIPVSAHLRTDYDSVVTQTKAAVQETGDLRAGSSNAAKLPPGG